MSDKEAPLVSLQPAATLVLTLERGIQAKTVLRVTNVSRGRIAFKVKTTQPTWYYVRPNQHILEAGKSEDVNIVLVDTECNRYLDQLANNQEEKMDKHRFLVQSKVLEDSAYERLLAMDPSVRAEELTKLWDGPKDDRKNIKLKVEFKYPSQAPRATASARSPGGDAELRAGLSRGEEVTSNTPEVMVSELQTMRKKYDAVVEYTVHLTAERDAIVAQLENLQRELNKEKAKKKGEAGTKSLQSEKLEKKTIDKGFSLFVVLFAAILSFVFGKYLSS